MNKIVAVLATACLSSTAHAQAGCYVTYDRPGECFLGVLNVDLNDPQKNVDTFGVVVGRVVNGAVETGRRGLKASQDLLACQTSLSSADAAVQAAQATGAKASAVLHEQYGRKLSAAKRLANRLRSACGVRCRAIR